MTMMITETTLATGPWTEFQDLIERLLPGHVGAGGVGRRGGERDEGEGRSRGERDGEHG